MEYRDDMECHMRISVCLQFTKHDLVFMWHVVTSNKFGKGALYGVTVVLHSSGPDLFLSCCQVLLNLRTCVVL